VGQYRQLVGQRPSPPLGAAKVVTRVPPNVVKKKGASLGRPGLAQHKADAILGNLGPLGALLRAAHHPVETLNDAVIDVFRHGVPFHGASVLAKRCPDARLVLVALFVGLVMKIEDNLHQREYP
jgi:hypothetical protein